MRSSAVDKEAPEGWVFLVKEAGAVQAFLGASAQ